MQSKFNGTHSVCYMDIPKIDPAFSKYYLAIGVKISIFIQERSQSFNENI